MFSIRKYKKAPLIIGAFFYFLLISKPALPQKKSEDVDQTIKQAQSLIIKHKRKEAIELLINKINVIQKDEKGRNLLSTTLTQIVEIFLTDKAQNIYEKAQSLYLKDSPDSLSLYLEANKLEPDNLKILIGLTRNLIKSKQCKRALDQISKHEIILPYFDSLKYLNLRIKECLNELLQLKEEDFKINDKSKKLYLLELKAFWHFQRGESKLALERAIQGIGLDKFYPENFYWAWRASNVHAHLQSYKRLCGALSDESKLKYIDSMTICSNMYSLPAEIEKNK